MCGIFALLNNISSDGTPIYDKNNVEDNFKKGKSRGPEITTMNYNHIDSNILLGFHRLAINGLDNLSNQPITCDDITLICNGEIYNYKKLYEIMNITPNTNSDCESIIHMYKKYGIKQTLIMLDGVFSFILYDKPNNLLYAARDPYGVRPLYHSASNNSLHPIIFSSEMKMLPDIKDTSIVKQFTPGHFQEFKYINKLWLSSSPIKYVSEPCINYTINNDWKAWPHPVIRPIQEEIYQNLCNAVKKRVVGTTERPIACLLSGGLDSSIICALVKKYYGKPFQTYSIGMPGSEDAKYAKIVAEHLGTIHTTIELSEDDFFNAIPEVIYAIESYDTTTVRASVGNYLVAKYIKEHSDAKVIFNGDGSDELCGGYLYFHNCPDEIEFDKECRRLLKDIHSFDVLRSDRSISSNGLEPRTPFLDRAFVQYYLSIPPYIRYHPAKKECEKYLLRSSFDRDNLLPKEILWRTKEAFSDGVSSLQKSWYEIINDKLHKYKSIPTLYDSFSSGDFVKKNFPHNTPTTIEQYMYRTIFAEKFPLPILAKTTPYFWLPKYSDAKDSSARTLDIYKQLNN